MNKYEEAVVGIMISADDDKTKSQILAGLIENKVAEARLQEEQKCREKSIKNNEPLIRELEELIIRLRQASI